MQQVILNLIVNAIEAIVAVVTRPKLLAIATMADVAGVIVSVNDSGQRSVGNDVPIPAAVQQGAC